MFSKLKIKFTLVLSFSITIFLLFFFIFTGYYTLYLLTEDSLEKKQQLQIQYAKSMELKLSALEERCSFILHDEYMKSAILDRNPSYISNILYTTQTSYDEISGICIVDNIGNCYSSDFFYANLPFCLFGEDYKIYLKNNIFEKKWYIADISAKNNIMRLPENPLVFLYPIKIQSRIEGYLILHCSFSNLCANFDYTDNIFLSKSDMYLKDGGRLIPVVSNNSPQTYTQNSEITLDKYQNISIVYSSEKSAANKFEVIICIWVLFFLLFLFSGFWWIKTYIKTIISPLCSLDKKMHEYINLKKKNITILKK